MNMAKKQNSFSSTKRDRNGETVPAIAGVEINEIRMYLMKFGCTPSKGKCICQKLTCRNWNTGLRRKTLLQNASQE